MNPTALAQAQDPSTSAEVLKRLAGSRDPEVLAAVAANPNVPPHLLWSLAGRFPGAVLRNPCFELLSLEDPLWLQRPSFDVVLGLTAHPDAPTWFIEQVAAGPLLLRLQMAARTRRPDLMWRLAQKAGAEKRLLTYLVSNPHAPASLLEHLAVECNMLEGVLRRQKRPAYFTEAALDDRRFKSLEGQCELARLPTLPAHQLERLASSPHEGVRRAVARSPAVSEALLERLARDPSPRVREQVALHERCPKPLAQALRQAQPLCPRPLPFKP